MEYFSASASFEVPDAVLDTVNSLDGELPVITEDVLSLLAAWQQWKNQSSQTAVMSLSASLGPLVVDQSFNFYTGQFDGKQISSREIHRFSNDPVTICGTFYWDILRLFFEIKQGISKAVHQGGFDAIGIDTWGVDFGLLDKKGRLLNNPVHYRDTRTTGIMEKVFEKVPQEELYGETGIQLMRINTIFQLYSLVLNEPETLAQADKLLLIPDLFAYLLTGEQRALFLAFEESRNASAAAYQEALREGVRRKLEDDVLAQSQTGGEANAFAIKQLARKSRTAGIGLRIRMEQQLGITGAEGTSFGAHELLDTFGGGIGRFTDAAKNDDLGI